MKLTQIALTVLLSAAVAFGVVKVAGPAAQTAPIKETRLEQIKRTGVLRCGYMIWPPIINRDPNTGKMSGMNVDLFEEIGRQLGVKVEWTMEMSTAHAFADLDSNRYDIGCITYFITPARAREALFMNPILYHPYYLFARADDTRFDNNYAAANDPSVTFSTLDGEFSSIGATEHFPQAKQIALPQNASGSDLFLNVADKKADLVVTEPMTFASFNTHNPNKLKQVTGEPVGIMPVSFPLPAKEYDLKEALDATTLYLRGTKWFDALLDRYENPEMKFLRLPALYQKPD
ncbi:MAG: transporter substrate-binding domain-containing protein [Bdellovibrionales bacterium]|jgi:polar amino acid transport system substrate-binding protein